MRELLHRSHMRGSRGPRGVSPLLIEAAQPRGARSPTCAIGGDSPEFQISNCLYDLKVPEYVEALGVGYFITTVSTLSAVRTGVVHI